MKAHDLSGKGKSNAGTLLFGGVERDKDLITPLRAYGGSIVGHLNDHILKGIQFYRDLYAGSLCLGRIFYKIYQNLGYLVLVCPKDYIFRFLKINGFNPCLRGLRGR